MVSKHFFHANVIIGVVLGCQFVLIMFRNYLFKWRL